MKRKQQQQKEGGRELSAYCVYLVCKCTHLYVCVCVGNMLCKSEVAQRGVWACLLLGQGMFLECRPWNSTPGVKIFICNPTLNCYPKTRAHTSLIFCWLQEKNSLCKSSVYSCVEVTWRNLLRARAFQLVLSTGGVLPDKSVASPFMQMMIPKLTLNKEIHEKCGSSFNLLMPVLTQRFHVAVVEKYDPKARGF